VAASSKKFSEATESTQPGWFSFCSQSENHPGLAISGGFAAFFWSLGHPSLRWCQEGNTRDSNSFTASMTARNVSVETLRAAFCEASVVTLVRAGVGRQIDRT